MSQLETAGRAVHQWNQAMEPAPETFNPWTVVNVVFHHLAQQGLHPVLGGADPGRPAADLLRALGVEPAAEGDRQIRENVKKHLAELRAAVLEQPDSM